MYIKKYIIPILVFLIPLTAYAVAEWPIYGGNADSIADGTIVNTDVNASAAIAGTKIDPVFGAQDVIVGDGVDTTPFVRIATTITGTSELQFADTDPNIGRISYTHTDNTMTFYADDAGKFIIAPTMLRAVKPLKIGGSPVLYDVFSNGTCLSGCASEPSGVNASSGMCLAAWGTGGFEQPCSIDSGQQFCLCAGKGL
jgi:hypothetical protein